jgi:flagellar biosynthesis GTPase FlhF
MKRLGIGSTALSVLLFGATFSFAQDKPAQHAEENKAPHEEQSAKPAQPAQHEQKAPPAQHTEKAQPAETAKRTETAKPAERTAKTEQAKPATQHAQTATRTSPAARTTASTRTTSTARTQNTQSVQRSEQAHNFGGHGGGHIADARFSASFGRAHSFHMNRPTLYEGYSRFNYGGYYFGFYDPWPSDWGYSDDVYVDYIDGQYFLIDPEHPGPRLMINVVI